MLDLIFKITGFVSSLLGAVAAGIAIYLYFFKRKPIISIFKLLLNYSMQLSLTELKTKLEKLNELNAGDAEQREDVLNILHDIMGQIEGNKKLKEQCKAVLRKILNNARNPQHLSEQIKRSLVSELRENLRHLELEGYDFFIRGKK